MDGFEVVACGDAVVMVAMDEVSESECSRDNELAADKFGRECWREPASEARSCADDEREELTPRPEPCRDGESGLSFATPLSAEDRQSDESGDSCLRTAAGRGREAIRSSDPLAARRC